MLFLTAIYTGNARADSKHGYMNSLDNRLLKKCKIQVGDSIRVNSSDHGILIGRLHGSRVDSLLIELSKGNERISIDNINQLWVLESSAMNGMKKGALAGSVTGSIIVPMLMKFISLGADEGGSYTAEDFLLHFSLGAITGAAGGAMLGYGIGSNMSHWDLRYQDSRFH